MSDDKTSDDKPQTNAPDYQVNHVRKNDKGQELWTSVGSGWEARDGYISADTVFGKMILTPKAELERMRAERQEKQQVSQEQAAESPKPSQPMH